MVIIFFDSILPSSFLLISIKVFLVIGTENLTIELPLVEVEPHYRNVLRQLRKTRMNGFRPGKFPKGWMEKRFKSVMHHEAVDNVIAERSVHALVGDRDREHALREGDHAKVEEEHRHHPSPVVSHAGGRMPG